MHYLFLKRKRWGIIFNKNDKYLSNIKTIEEILKKYL